MNISEKLFFFTLPPSPLLSLSFTLPNCRNQDRVVVRDLAYSNLRNVCFESRARTKSDDDDSYIQRHFLWNDREREGGGERSQHDLLVSQRDFDGHSSQKRQQTAGQ